MPWRPSRRLLIGALPAELTLGQAAFELGITKGAVWAWKDRKTNPLPAHQRPDGTWVIGLELLRAWLGLNPRAEENDNGKEAKEKQEQDQDNDD